MIWIGGDTIVVVIVPYSYSCVLSRGPLDRKAGLYRIIGRYYGQARYSSIIGIKVGSRLGSYKQVGRQGREKHRIG